MAACTWSFTSNERDFKRARRPCARKSLGAALYSPRGGRSARGPRFAPGPRAQRGMTFLNRLASWLDHARRPVLKADIQRSEASGCDFGHTAALDGPKRVSTIMLTQNRAGPAQTCLTLRPRSATVAVNHLRMR
jgi:hypothetical protein